jgi:hypothetical protein
MSELGMPELVGGGEGMIGGAGGRLLTWVDLAGEGFGFRSGVGEASGDEDADRVALGTTGELVTGSCEPPQAAASSAISSTAGRTDRTPGLFMSAMFGWDGNVPHTLV